MLCCKFRAMMVDGTIWKISNFRLCFALCQVIKSFCATWIINFITELFCYTCQMIKLFLTYVWVFLDLFVPWVRLKPKELETNNKDWHKYYFTLHVRLFCVIAHVLLEWVFITLNYRLRFSKEDLRQGSSMKQHFFF